MNMKKLLCIEICALVIAVILAFVQIDDLRADLSSLKNSVDNNAHRLEQEISSIYDNVDEQMKKKASLFSSVSHSLGSLDKETEAVELRITVVPKVITDGMSVKVSAGENVVEMQKSKNGEYTATLDVGMFEEYDTYPLVTIRSGNETKTEYLETVNMSYLWSKYLPSGWATEFWSDSITYKEEDETEKSTVTVDGHAEFSYSEAENSDVRFEKIYIAAETEKGEIGRKDITDIARNPEYDDTVALSVPFREVYRIGGSEELCLYVVAEDSLGYTHKVKLLEWTRPDDEGKVREPENAPGWAGVRDRRIWIYDKEGKLLFGDEF